MKGSNMNMKKKHTLLLFGFALCVFLSPLTADEQKGAREELIQVPPPPFSEDIFPCSECHGDMEPNPERRMLEDMHDDIILKHDFKTFSNYNLYHDLCRSE